MLNLKNLKTVVIIKNNNDSFIKSSIKTDTLYCQNIDEIVSEDCIHILRQHIINQLTEEFENIDILVAHTDNKDKKLDVSTLPTFKCILVLNDLCTETLQTDAQHDLQKDNLQKHALISSYDSMITLADIRQKFVDNKRRDPLHLIDAGRLAKSCLNQNIFKNKGQLADFLGLSSSTLSRALRCAKFISDADYMWIKKWDINGERTLLSITKLIENDFDWVSLVKQHALDENGSFNYKLIDSALFARIEKELFYNK